MKICVIGFFGGKNDEGMANFAFNLSKELSKKHDILEISFSPFLMINPNFWIKTLKFKPDVFHFIIGPKILGLSLVKILKTFFRKSLFIISCMQPNFPNISEKFIGFFKPDLVLVQTNETEFLFKNAGFKTEFIPSGVDIDKFSPVNYNKKKELKTKYGFPIEKFIILHVGHIKKGRNLLLFNEISKNDNYQVLIIGSTSTELEMDLQKELENNGCVVLREYFENIQELYQLSDCYLFPTIDKKNCIEMPLSVMEASSCNLPVISTRYGKLEELFEEGQGLYYLDDWKSLIDILEKIRLNRDDIETRKMVLRYSWKSIANQISTIYSENRYKK